ncbi:phage holin family protein [Paracoccus methylovorus]|uniref:Phage holin family protein n=1 Tax=Paracoccus methylovorus TaxID=2812658 RepID=A0ABX7JLK2_9RHOB|nr:MULTISPECIES: phage holin family protein [Paracoccus]QRZ15122.1 phage holin family protein [Paracoccus methylovorus]
MIRLIAMIVIELAASAVGLLAAAWLLPDFTLSISGFLWAIGVFTAARLILAPLIFKLSFQHARALTGGIALVTTFAGLLVTTWLTDGLQINGVSTWIIATLIVWLFGVVAVLLLPMIIFKKALAKARSGAQIPPMR